MYKPQKHTKIILDRAMELINSVPYSVSSRWVFYRLFQEGYYTEKKHYNSRWIGLTERARKNFYNGWTPYTLADDTRQAIIRGDGFIDEPGAWVNRYIKHISQIENHNVEACKWQYQDYYIELWFEARAMVNQFLYYTENIPLVPMSGQPSIPYKWKIAKRLETIDKPIIILYFGDLDKGGHDIANATRFDVSWMSGNEFKFIHCGLNTEQIEKYNVPENFENPGYQWEALTDEQAREIITSSIKPFYRQDSKTKALDDEREARRLLKERLSKLT